MNTPTSARRGARSRQSVNYKESPVDSPALPKSARKSLYSKSESPDENIDKNGRSKTPKSSKVRKASEESEDYSPKKLRGTRTPSAKSLESIVTENSPTMQNLESPPKQRRSMRERKSAPRYSDINLKINLKEMKVKPAKEIKSDVKADEEESEKENDSEFAVKPTMLFDEDEDVEGQKLYSFKTPKKKDSMATLAQHTPKTPHRSTPQTPKNNRLSELQKTPTSRPSAAEFAKTPKHIRAAIKKKLVKATYEEGSDGDFSADESDFEPNEASSSSTSEDWSENDEPEPPPKKAQSVAARVLKTPSVRRSARNQVDYVLQSDDYFSTATSKTKTSDHTLDRLKNPRLPHDQLIKLLSNMALSAQHEKAVKDLNDECKSLFDKWLTLFDEGYTVVLHGLGSKRNLLQAFHKERLENQHVMVVNGFFPSLTVKDILDNIQDLLEMATLSGNPHEVVAAIEDEMNDLPSLNLFLIVHNIDGTMLRNDKAQSVLSRLASIKNLHMICSIDHINAPLLWNNIKLSNYNFVWFDVTSFLPYTEETSFENSILVQSSGALELSSMKSVFQSLTSNARGIYVLVVKHQLKNGRNPNYQGMSFKELYSSCREAFLVSTDVALRAQLTEFLDHKLAKLKRTAEGTENITIPIKNILLEQFLSEQN